MTKKTLKESRTPEVGPFYMIDGVVYAATESIRDITPGYSRFRDSDNFHYEYWKVLQMVEPELKRYDYDYFPRGRAVYNTTDDTYYLYIDNCINNDKDISKITDELNLPFSKVKVMSDEHYQCHQCDPDYVDISENYRG